MILVKLWLASLVAVLTACAVPPKPVVTHGQNVWSGRLAITVEATPVMQTSAGFSLVGSPQAGQLELFTPLGNKAANVSWTSDSAIVTRGQDSKNYLNLETALEKLIQTSLPINAFFDWLAGTPTPVVGWDTDVSRYAEGRLFLVRQTPLPRTEIRVVLEK
jgi:outer membrane lipoprotein LolB